MKLQIEIASENGQESYYAPIRIGEVHRTESFDTVPCGMSADGKAVYYELASVRSDLKAKMTALSERYSNVVPVGAGFRFEIQKLPVATVSGHGLINFDLGADGAIVGIEFL